MRLLRRALEAAASTLRADGKVEIKHVPDVDGSAINLGDGVLITAGECGWVSPDRARALVDAGRAVYVTRVPVQEGDTVWIHRPAGTLGGIELGEGLGTIEPGQTRRVPVAIARRVVAVGRVTYAQAPPNAARR